MQRTYRVPRARVGLAGLLAMLVLLAIPGTSIAGGASESTRPAGIADTAQLQRGAGYGDKAAQTAPVRVLQQKLRALGWQPGPVDGLFGPMTEAAVVRFQKDAGLMVDAIVGPQTQRALDRARTSPLRRGVGYAQPDGSPRVQVLQHQLRRHGFRPGPIDGIFGPRTEAALTRFQRTGGLPANGVVTQRTGLLLAGAEKATEPTVKAEAPRSGDEKPRTTRPESQGERRLAVSPTAAETSNPGGDTVDVPLVITTGLLALLLGAVLATMLARLRPGGMDTAVPLAHSVVAEGWARTRSIGPFRGRVHALVLGRGGFLRPPETRYLVSDPRKKGPFWVTHEEVSRLVAPSPTVEGVQRGVEVAGATDEVRVLGYVSVRDAGQLENIHLQEQADAIVSLCEERGWQLVEVIRDVDETEDRGLERPGLQYALERIGRGEASCLVVSQLGRLSRSAAEISRILELLRHADARLVAMDVELDTASPDARVAVNALTAVGALDPSPSTAVTPARVAALRATRPRVTRGPLAEAVDVKERIVAMREQGMTLQAIADRLNDERVPTLGGGLMWRPSSVRYAVRSAGPPGNGASHYAEGGA
jgi:peptidoglycan hydrolase-like protein with peptidoglycan-binding domain/DNA invertase Pin-like site-specific DNA recombinase